MAPAHPAFRHLAALASPQLFLARRPWDDKAERLRTQITVDEVRALKGFFQRSAADGGHRVAIVDAADELNGAAANALLKILEEPPAGRDAAARQPSAGRPAPDHPLALPRPPPGAARGRRPRPRPRRRGRPARPGGGPGARRPRRRLGRRGAGADRPATGSPATTRSSPSSRPPPSTAAAPSPSPRLRPGATAPRATPSPSTSSGSRSPASRSPAPARRSRRPRRPRRGSIARLGATPVQGAALGGARARARRPGGACARGQP